MQTPEPVLITPEIPSEFTSELTLIIFTDGEGMLAQLLGCHFSFKRRMYISCSLHVCPAFILWFQNNRAGGPKATTPPPYTYTPALFLTFHPHRIPESQGPKWSQTLLFSGFTSDSCRNPLQTSGEGSSSPGGCNLFGRVGDVREG